MMQTKTSEFSENSEVWLKRAMKYLGGEMNYEDQLREYFEGLGYRALKIKEGDTESADFLISKGSEHYLLELKTKFPSLDNIKERENALASQGVHVIQEIATRKNRLSGIIKKATDQLGTHEIPDDFFRMVWLIASGHLAEAQVKQFEATLYGSTTILDKTNERSGICFFFRNSDFYRFREILDAAIVSTESDATLLLNPFSSHFERLKTAALVNHFNGGIDPIELEMAGKAFIVDGDIDRNDTEAVLHFLKTKYHSQILVNVDMTYLSGTLVIP